MLIYQRVYTFGSVWGDSLIPHFGRIRRQFYHRSWEPGLGPRLPKQRRQRQMTSRNRTAPSIQWPYIYIYVYIYIYTIYLCLYLYIYIYLLCQWPFQEPKLEVPTIYKVYILGLCKGISQQNMAKNMVQYLHFRILKFPLSICCWSYFLVTCSLNLRVFGQTLMNRGLMSFPPNIINIVCWSMVYRFDTFTNHQSSSRLRRAARRDARTRRSRCRPHVRSPLRHWWNATVRCQCRNPGVFPVGCCNWKTTQVAQLWDFRMPSGKRLHKTMEHHHFQWVNPLFLWPFSIAMLNYLRVFHVS